MIETTPEFWDCDCDEHYIHAASEHMCPTCGAHRDEDHPDSMLDEVKAGTHFYIGKTDTE